MEGGAVEAVVLGEARRFAKPPDDLGAEVLKVLDASRFVGGPSMDIGGVDLSGPMFTRAS